MAHGLCCSVACEIFLDQESNCCPLHWQADSQPLCHQGSPGSTFLRLLPDQPHLGVVILGSFSLLILITPQYVALYRLVGGVPSPADNQSLTTLGPRGCAFIHKISFDLQNILISHLTANKSEAPKVTPSAVSEPELELKCQLPEPVPLPFQAQLLLNGKRDISSGA